MTQPPARPASPLLCLLQPASPSPFPAPQTPSLSTYCMQPSRERRSWVRGPGPRPPALLQHPPPAHGKTTGDGMGGEHLPP